MVVSIACDGLPSRHPRVHVPAFADPSLPGAHRIVCEAVGLAPAWYQGVAAG